MADDGDDLAYLQPDFDPTSLTVARLRNVLLTHGVSWPSSAKKAELVQLFNTELKPRARKILTQRRKTQRSSKGIEDAPSSLTSSFDTDEEKEEVKPSTMKKPSRGRPKKATAPPTEDSESTLVPNITSKTTGRSKSRGRSVKQAPASEPVASPPPKQEPSDPAAWREYSKDSPFSHDNPFQSGSSPLSAPISVPKRRKTDSSDTKITKQRSTSLRRKTAQTPLPGPRSTKKSNKLPVEELPYDDEIDVSEEFTLEEQQELEEERRKGNVAIVPVRRTTARQDAISWKPPILVFILILLSGLAILWRQEKINVGYCGIGAPSDNIFGVEIPPWAGSLRPQCEQCPQHATCRENLITDCEHGFVLKRNLLSLNGLLPFVPWCEADGEKAKRVKAVADRMEAQIRDRRAQAECGAVDANGKSITPEIEEEEMKSSLSAMKRRGLTDEEFESLYQEALPELSGREEVVVTLDE
jgi:hypothetical protein